MQAVRMIQTWSCYKGLHVGKVVSIINTIYSWEIERQCTKDHIWAPIFNLALKKLLSNLDWFTSHRNRILLEIVHMGTLSSAIKNSCYHSNWLLSRFNLIYDLRKASRVGKEGGREGQREGEKEEGTWEFENVFWDKSQNSMSFSNNRCYKHNFSTQVHLSCYQFYTYVNIY